jgi:hypothetical protein
LGWFVKIKNFGGAILTCVINLNLTKFPLYIGCGVLLTTVLNHVFKLLVGILFFQDLS